MGGRIAPALASRVLAWLKRANPANLRAYLVDGETRDIALSKSRQKWQRAMATIAEIGWVRLEAYDARGQLCAPPFELEQAGGAGELEDLGGGVPPSSQAARELHLVRLLITYGDNLLLRFGEMLRPMLDANRVVLGDLSMRLAEANKRTDQLDRTVSNVYDQLGAAVRAAAAKGDDGAGELQQLLAAAPQIVQMLQAIGVVQPPAPRPPAPPRLAGPSSNSPPAKPNGVPKNGAPVPPPSPPPPSSPPAK